MAFKVSPRHYFEEREFAEELNSCLQDYWIFVCPSAVVREPGDYFVFHFGGVERVIRRRSDGGLQSFDNRCKHRGHKIYPDLIGSGDVRCPYHGWLYADDNSLAKLPWNDKCYHLAQEDIALDQSCHLMERYSLVWVYLGDRPLGEVRFPAENIGAAIEVFARQYGTAYGLVVNRESFNWRLIFDNLYDRVHPAFLHAQSLVKTVSLKFDPYPKDFNLPESDAYVEANVAQTGQRLDASVASDFIETGEFEKGTYVNGHIYPYLHFFTPDGGETFCFESYLPVSATCTEIQIFWVASKNVPKNGATNLLSRYIHGAAVVLREDWDAVKSITAVKNKPETYTYGAHEVNALSLIRIAQK
jgi:phenylpropionate dioxygenase-like ring-hydroxylating dioxygenase large terminal subunit